MDRLRLVRPGDSVVDLGCGCGSMVPGLGERIGDRGRYLGIDVHGPSIFWCQRRFGSDPRFRFELIGPAFRVPIPDGTAGFVLAKSLFTHLLEPETRAYLAEVRRILSPGRRAVVTAFLFAGNGESPPFFPHPRDTGSGTPVRWLRAARPRAAVAYDRSCFEDLVTEAGLEIVAFVPGFWPGADRPPKGQDTLVLERPAEVS